ncbi:unnamed protein product, partial [Amoebophrya sp. A120]|eukprot:GSA120T00020471001.1
MHHSRTSYGISLSGSAIQGKVVMFKKFVMQNLQD